MYALKMLGLVVLAGICVVAFVVGYDYFQGLSTSQEAREQAGQLNEEIKGMIVSGVVGENKKVTVSVPGDYTLRFNSETNQLVMDGVRLPEDGYDMTVEGPKENLGPGEHELLIVMKSDKIKVSEIG